MLVAIAASLLTLVSGFGLGTLMLPVFALFFPLEVAVGMTAVVHLLNNVFKFALMYRHVDTKVLLWFGVPRYSGAWAGAKLLMLLGHGPTLYMGIREGVDGLDLVIAVLMVLFSITELLPHLAQFSFKPKYLLPGGVISGFFGGLSGHQGALRTMFLLRAGLSKESFIGTGIAIALLIDLTPIPFTCKAFQRASARARPVPRTGHHRLVLGCLPRQTMDHEDHLPQCATDRGRLRKSSNAWDARSRPWT